MIEVFGILFSIALTVLFWGGVFIAIRRYIKKEVARQKIHSK